jgi:hypothetical protein
MTNLRKRLLYVVAAAVLACSATAWADGPSSGVGGDGFTRFMWTGSDSRIRVERCNATLGGCTSLDYGPFPTWIPIAYCVANNNNSYVLWRNTSGSVSIWRLDVNLVFQTSATYGQVPFLGWTAYELSCSTNTSNTARLLWRNTNGGLSIWIINPDLTVGTTATFAQPFGWVPGAGAETESATNAAAQAKAQEAMDKATASIPGAQP